jgi:ABC-type uncharacterized transport system permease subunit
MSSLAAATADRSLPRRLGPRAATTATANEIQKGLLHAWAERLQILIEVPLFLVFFLLAALVLGRGEQIASGHLDWRFDPARVSTLFVGYAAFVFLYLQTAKLFWRLLGEIQAGTLEQVYLSPLPAWLVATAGRVLATVLETAGVVAILYIVVFAIAPFNLVWRAQALVPITFIVVGSVGYSLIEGGLTLAWKRVELLHELALGLMVFFSGALVPLDRLPAWMADIGRFTPISQGIVALRAMLVNGAAALPLGGDGGLVPLAAISLGYLFAGIIVFSVGEAVAKRRGSLARY